jgi:hypothetical protein
VNRGSILRPAIFAVGLVLCSAPSQADDVYYRWLDAQGDPVHSDRPPPAGTPYEVVSSKTARSRRVGGDQGSSAEGSAATPIEGRVNTYLTQKPIPKDPARCQQARDNLATLETGMRIRMQDANGDFYFISDEEREIQKANAQANIDAYCED